MCSVTAAQVVMLETEIQVNVTKNIYIKDDQYFI